MNYSIKEISTISYKIAGSQTTGLTISDNSLFIKAITSFDVVFFLVYSVIGFRYPLCMCHCGKHN